MLSSQLLPAITPSKRLSMARDATSEAKWCWAKQCSLIRVFAMRSGQIPQPSPEQRFGEGAGRAEEPPDARGHGV